MTAKIILLNGVGSAGKSSIAKALQAIASKPYLHVQMDAFLDMLPEVYQNHPGGFSFETTQEDGKPIVAISTGPVGEQTMRGSGMPSRLWPGKATISLSTMCFGAVARCRSIERSYPTSLCISLVFSPPSMFLRRGKGSVVTG
jgi:chloramphenicol 3-O phosphotransferase